MKENLKINLKIFICNLIGTFQLIKTSLGLNSDLPTQKSFSCYATILQYVCPFLNNFPCLSYQT